MPFGELFLDGTVKSLKVTVGLRMVWVIEEMHQVVITAGLVKMLEEFTAVIGLDMGDGERSYGNEFFKEVLSVG